MPLCLLPSNCPSDFQTFLPLEADSPVFVTPHALQALFLPQRKPQTTARYATQTRSCQFTPSRSLNLPLVLIPILSFLLYHRHLLPTLPPLSFSFFPSASPPPSPPLLSAWDPSRCLWPHPHSKVISLLFTPMARAPRTAQRTRAPDSVPSLGRMTRGNYVASPPGPFFFFYELNQLDLPFLRPET